MRKLLAALITSAALMQSAAAEEVTIYALLDCYKFGCKLPDRPRAQAERSFATAADCIAYLNAYFKGGANTGSPDWPVTHACFAKKVETWEQVR